MHQSNRSKSSGRSTVTNYSNGTGSSLPSTASTVRAKGGVTQYLHGRQTADSVGESAGSTHDDSDTRSNIKDSLQIRDVSI